MNLLYIFRAASPYKNNLVKIGVSSNVGKRLKQIQTSCPYRIELLEKAGVNDAYGHEKAIHDQYKKYKLKGEWFLLPDSTLFGIRCDFDFLSAGDC